MKEMFKQIPLTMSKELTPKKSPETYDRYWLWMVYGKSAKGLPPLSRPKLSKKAQDKQDDIPKKKYETNKWWNYWKLQLHWHTLEWVNPISTNKRDKPYLVSSTKFYLNK